VRIPAEMAFAPKTELRVSKDGNRVIIEPKSEGLGRLASLFAETDNETSDRDRTRPPQRDQVDDQGAARPISRPVLTRRR